MDYDDAADMFFELFPQCSSLQEKISLSVILPRIIPRKELLFYMYIYIIYIKYILYMYVRHAPHLIILVKNI